MVAWRYSVHNAGGKVSYLFTVAQSRMHTRVVYGYWVTENLMRLRQCGEGLRQLFFFCFRLLTLGEKNSLRNHRRIVDCLNKDRTVCLGTANICVSRPGDENFMWVNSKKQSQMHKLL